MNIYAGTDSETELTFLTELKKNKIPVKIYLKTGIALSGIIKGFDFKVVLLEDFKCNQLIYKRSIASILPSAPEEKEKISDKLKMAVIKSP